MRWSFSEKKKASQTSAHENALMCSLSCRTFTLPEMRWYVLHIYGKIMIAYTWFWFWLNIKNNQLYFCFDLLYVQDYHKYNIQTRDYLFWRVIDRLARLTAELPRTNITSSHATKHQQKIGNLSPGWNRHFDDHIQCPDISWCLFPRKDLS